MRRVGQNDVVDDEDDAAILPPSPLRAVTLVDTQGYALRAVSLVPAASGWIGGTSAFGFGGGAPQDTQGGQVRALHRETNRLRA